MSGNGPILKNKGVNPAERYLNALCERTFLSLWSYPCIYRDQGGNNEGKEICDHIVIFENDIIIFSDKYCKYPETGKPDLDWRRWFKRSVVESAKQVWAAERWIRNFPDRVFLDQACTTRIPVPLPDMKNARFHLIVVAHDGARKCAEVHGGSGSFMLKTDLIGIENHKEPFVVGRLDSTKTFVHVFDDTALDVVINNVDTISDFTAYLRKKEKLFDGDTAIFITGEEELLAIYLKDINDDGEHDFVFPKSPSGKVDGIALMEGHWEAFQTNPQRLAQIEADRVSYLWDHLIEQFAQHALSGTQHSTSGDITHTERILRFMARESRFYRRIYSKCLDEMMRITSEKQRRLRVVASGRDKSLYYVFLLFPSQAHFKDANYEDYRKVRTEFLRTCCNTVKLLHPEALDIVGFATESGINNGGRSEDAIYFDARTWTSEMEENAKRDQLELQILISPNEISVHNDEYPKIKIKPGKNPRNKPCPCGSQKKYKKCCGS